jgi:uncharacterized protein YjbI with pentapeptide repeats
MSQEESQDVERSLAAIQEATRTVSARFVTFLTVGAYIALTVASTTDEMLVKGIQVKLPIINTEIPITGWLGFYTLVPWLIVALHLDRMLQLSILASKLTDLEARMEAVDQPTRDRIRLRLPAQPYVQFFAADPSAPVQTVLAGLVVCGSMIVLPLLLLCWIQVRFLALHDPIATLSHGLAVLTDVVLILIFLWPPLVARDARRVRKGTYRIPTRGLVLCACGAVFVLSIAANLPDYSLPRGVQLDPPGLDLRERILTASPLTPDAVNAITDGNVRRREEELAKVSRQGFMQGRDLRHANLFHAVLARLDLRSRLEGDQLVETQLQGANLKWARMQQVLLDDANLQKADLTGAQLQGARLMRTKCEDARLDGTQLQEATLDEAVFTRASLRDAKLQGASLVGTDLRGAHLEGAQLQGANLHGARLQQANLSGASLAGADLTGAQLEGATLRGASLRGAVLDNTLLDANTDVKEACFDLTERSREHKCCDPGPCLAPEDPAFPRARTDLVMRLACEDAYAARGIANQALRRKDSDKATLVRALHDARDEATKCEGVQTIPDETAHEIARLAPAADGERLARRDSRKP